MRRCMFAIFFVILLTACGSSQSGLTVDDLAIVKVDNEKEIVRYGMSRASVEKVLGEGSEGNHASYDNGVSVLYRENSVVAIALKEESKSIYKTLQGAEINMNKDDLIKIYGKDNGIGVNEGKNLDYIYDLKAKKYLSEIPKSPEDRTKIYHVSIMFNDDGEADSIWLLDNQAATLAN